MSYINQIADKSDGQRPNNNKKQRKVPDDYFIPPKGSIYSRYKMTMCRNFEDNNFCCHGDSCTFAHSKGERRRGYNDPVHISKSVKELINAIKKW
jgi:hypothetical protein